MNQGDDIGGIVVKVGSNVTEFKPGDRVGALHQILTPHGSYAEHAITSQHTTFHIPAQTTFQQAAALPMAAMTAGIALYVDLGLPQPWNPAVKPVPLIVYGGHGSRRLCRAAGAAEQHSPYHLRRGQLGASC